MSDLQSKNPLMSLLFRSAGLITGVVYLVYMIFHNEVPIDTGDGIVHFGYAQDSWEHREQLLFHWAKPLFTLLSSPFAQFGYNVYLLFNVLVYLLTCVTVFLIFRKLRLAAGYFVFFPLVLLAAPDYTACVLGGMTEPLFGLLLAIILCCAFSERWILLAIVASFTLFSRSEGMLIVCLSALLLVYNKAWRALPFLATGFVIYGFAGIPVYGTFWWYFTEDPYTATGFYGRGNWYDYIRGYSGYAGHSMRYLVPVGCFGWYLLYRRKDGPGKGILFFSVAVFVLILLVHSYLWYYGLKGSAGLTRLGTLGLIPLVIALFIGANRFTKELHLLPQAVLFIVFGYYLGKKISLLPYPKHATENERTIMQAADYVKAHFPDRRVKYFSPLFGWKMGARVHNDPLVNIWYFYADTTVLNKLGEGEIVVRDMFFGHAEAGLPRDFIAGRKELKVVKVFESHSGQHPVPGEKNDVIVFEIDRDQ